MKVAIMTDSNSGITQKEAKELGIKVIPMPFTIDGKEYFEDINLTQDQFYEKLLSDADVSTSQPSEFYVNEAWDELLKEYDQIVYIPMSSGLSKTCSTLTLSSTKPEYQDKVFVVDNQRISVTQKLSVFDAMKLAELGYSGKEIKDILLEMKMDSDIFITLATLKYLKKGGRITPAAAALGGLLKIKPVLLIKGEKLDKYRMRNRTMENAKSIMIDAIKDTLVESGTPAKDIQFCVAYTGTEKEEALKFAEEIKKEFNTDHVLCDPLSLSVSCHIGDGALAIATSKKLPQKYLNK